MRILIAPDKFRDSLDAMSVAKAMAKGLQLQDKDIDFQLFPLADGGEGTAKILSHHTEGTLHTIEVTDPLLRPIEATYGISADGKTAFIEMAAASGLHLLQPSERNCYYTSSYGTGELILDALEHDVEHIILGIGGSATNDAGIGMANALGYRFMDKFNMELAPIGESLEHIAKIDATNMKAYIGNTRFTVAYDVDCPLHGPQGAAYTYGRQKGAGFSQIESLDLGLENFARITKWNYRKDVASMAGAGAAGGMGAGAYFFLNAEARKGTELIMEICNFQEQLKDTDLILTGEGSLDSQTLQGKVIQGICETAKPLNIPVVALCGSIETNPELIQKLEGLTYAISICNQPKKLSDALKNTQEDLAFAAFNLLRFMQKPQQNKLQKTIHT
ncbi:MAG: glycerate kinase [Chitinophagales bacterium]